MPGVSPVQGNTGQRVRQTGRRQQENGRSLLLRATDRR
jgi:hypothetical protein